MELGGAQLSEVVYCFYQGRFSGVLLTTAKNFESREALKDAFRAQFGAGHRPNRFLDRWLWFGATTHISVTCPAGQSICKAYLFSRMVNQRDKDDREREASGAKQDF